MMRLGGTLDFKNVPELTVMIFLVVDSEYELVWREQ